MSEFLYSSIEEINTLENSFIYLIEVETVSFGSVIKIGKTEMNIKTRLKQYKDSVKNILCINCSEASNRERIIKKYIKNKLKYKPIIGNEYFDINLRKMIERIVSYFGKMDTQLISKYNDLIIKGNMKNIFDSVENDIISSYKEEQKNNYEETNSFLNETPNNNSIDMLGLDPIDLSIESFNKIVKEKYTYDVYDKMCFGQYVIRYFFCNTEGQIKVKLLENDISNIIFIDLKNKLQKITPNIILGLLKNSSSFKELTELYERRYINENNTFEYTFEREQIKQLKRGIEYRSNHLKKKKYLMEQLKFCFLSLGLL